MPSTSLITGTFGPTDLISGGSIKWCLWIILRFRRAESASLTNPTTHLSHIPQCVFEQKYANFHSNVVHCEIWDSCVMGSVTYILHMQIACYAFILSLLISSILIGYMWLNIIQRCIIIMCVRPANKRRCYHVTSSPIGWAHTHNMTSASFATEQLRK